jgi:hypothetical protein
MRQQIERPVLLLNDAALQLPPDVLSIPTQAQIIIAGQSLVRMTLAELAVPGAQLVWTDFRQSASLCALHRSVQAAGGLDHLILAADGDEGQAMFSLMCAVLTLLPALRRRPGARVQLVVEAGRAVTSLKQFIERIAPKLSADRVEFALQIVERRQAIAAA